MTTETVAPSITLTRALKAGARVVPASDTASEWLRSCGYTEHIQTTISKRDGWHIWVEAGDYARRFHDSHWIEAPEYNPEAGDVEDMEGFLKLAKVAAGLWTAEGLEQAVDAPESRSGGYLSGQVELIADATKGLNLDWHREYIARVIYHYAVQHGRL